MLDYTTLSQLLRATKEIVMSNEMDVSGSATVLGDGSVLIEARVGDYDSIEIKLESYEEYYVLRFDAPLMMGGIRVSDLIEARVEIATVLREYYGFDEEEIFLCKIVIDKAWREPSEVYDNIKELVDAHEYE
jgi:hypothetical protein